MNNLTKIDRLAAWLLFIFLILYFVSGYGMTKGLIDARVAANLHLDILTYAILVVFIIHTACAIRLALIRWNMWKGVGVILWLVFYLAFIFGFIYVDRFYKIPKVATSPTNQPSADTAKTTTGNNTTQTNDTKTFTLAELAKYNGQNGNPSYVAVDGVVYDMTGIFTDGFHFSHFAGKDLSNEFYTKHVKSQISKYPDVGNLIK